MLLTCILIYSLPSFEVMQVGAPPSKKMNRQIVYIPPLLSMRPPSRSYLSLSRNFYMGFLLVGVGVVYWLSALIFFGLYHPQWCATHGVQECYTVPGFVLLFLSLVFLVALYLTSFVTISDPGFLTTGEKSDFREMCGAVTDQGLSTDRLPTPLSVLRCGYCNVFIHGYDHHCHIIGACVGKRNFGLFLSFLVADYLLAIVLFITYLCFVVSAMRGSSPSAHISLSEVFPAWPATNLESVLRFVLAVANVVSPLSFGEGGPTILAHPNVTIPVGGLCVGLYLISFVTTLLFTYFRLALLGMETVEVRFAAKVMKARSEMHIVVPESDKSVDHKNMEWLLATASPNNWLYKKGPPQRATFKQVFAMMKFAVFNSRLSWSTADGEPSY